MRLTLIAAGADYVQAGDQSQNGKTDRTHDSAQCVGASGSSDSIGASREAVGVRKK